MAMLCFKAKAQGGFSLHATSQQTLLDGDPSAGPRVEQEQRCITLTTWQCVGDGAVLPVLSFPEQAEGAPCREITQGCLKIKIDCKYFEDVSVYYLLVVQCCQAKCLLS